MKKPFFSLSEFLITKPKTIDVGIADKLMNYHIIPMLPVREELDISMTASQRSGYRPRWWEKKRGRSGNSQHVFIGLGAVDWTCKNFKENKDKFLELILKHTDYSRIAIYDGFLHCDHRKTSNGKTAIYKSNSKSEWEFLRYD